MFSCEFCGFSKNSLFTEHLRATASRCQKVLIKAAKYLLFFDDIFPLNCLFSVMANLIYKVTFFKKFEHQRVFPCFSQLVIKTGKPDYK